MGAGEDARGEPGAGGPRGGIRRLGLPAGPALALIVYMILPDRYAGPEGAPLALDQAARATLAAAVWMATWWLSEAIPVYATALLPLAFFPITGVATGRAAAAPYGHPLIFLFMGGFLLALCMERWGLHRRLAFRALQLVGDRPARVVGGFMGVSALLSMWVSNTATAIMMLPVGLSVVGPPAGADPREDRLAVCLLLGIAYGCTIGGVATPIGTPPNVFLLSYLESEMGLEVGFGQWMLLALPLSLVFLPLAWWVLTRPVFKLDAQPLGAAEVLRREHEAMGPLGVGERSVALAFACAVLLWVGRPLLSSIEGFGARPLAGLTDASIAMMAALSLFVLPGANGQKARDWETAVRLPWGILLLFGGGLSLAAAIRANGVDAFIAAKVGQMDVLPSWLVVVGVVALIVFLTELTSNTATCATFVPLLAGMGPVLEVEPLVLVVPAAVAASFAFMLPVATPPNAVVFGAGRVGIPQMSRAGLRLNLLAIVVIPLLAFLLVRPVLIA